MSNENSSSVWWDLGRRESRSKANGTWRMVVLLVNGDTPGFVSVSFPKKGLINAHAGLEV